jgi:hypothetical protein
MRNAFQVVALFVALLLMTSTSRAFDFRRLLGIGCSDGCGSADACGCEADCGCEPACGCGDGCGVNGRQFAGQTWNGCRESGPPICTCTGPSRCCDTTSGCGDACGCGDGCEPGCGCEPACGCASSCSCDHGNCGRCGCCFGSFCGHLVGCVDRLCGCSGCDGELYWSEWHNDPPRCCDPCDCHGNWVGPSSGGYRAPYDHPYYVGNANASQQVARSVRPPTRGMTRKPATGKNNTYQR